eukprot:1441841-Amphidinium_carterae.1
MHVVCVIPVEGHLYLTMLTKNYPTQCQQNRSCTSNQNSQKTNDCFIRDVVKWIDDMYREQHAKVYQRAYTGYRGVGSGQWHR